MQAGCELQQTFQCFKDDHHAKFTDSGVIFYSIYYCLLAQTNGTAFALAEGWAFIALEWMRDTWRRTSSYSVVRFEPTFRGTCRESGVARSVWTILCGITRLDLQSDPRAESERRRSPVLRHYALSCLDRRPLLLRGYDRQGFPGVHR